MNNLLTPIEIERPSSIKFGPGLASTIGAFALARGCSRPLVVSDPFNAGRVELLGLPGKVAVFGTVKPEPDIPNLGALLSMAADVQPDIVIGFGGGSAMDLAKLAAVLPGSEHHSRRGWPRKGAWPQGGAGAGPYHLRHRQRGRHARPRH